MKTVWECHGTCVEAGGQREELVLDFLREVLGIRLVERLPPLSRPPAPLSKRSLPCLNRIPEKEKERQEPRQEPGHLQDT